MPPGKGRITAELFEEFQSLGGTFVLQLCFVRVVGEKYA
jgi:hypothetical protein